MQLHWLLASLPFLVGGSLAAPSSTHAVSLDDAIDALRGRMEPRQAGGGDGSTPPAGNWTVQDMFRDVDVEKHTITVGFSVLDGTSDGSRCMLVLTPPEGVDMQTWEWYNKKCEESGYYASWGYLAEQDAGIMTLVNSDRNSEAFFGFPGISSGVYLGDAGPNPVMPCNCG